MIIKAESTIGINQAHPDILKSRKVPPEKAINVESKITHMIKGSFILFEVFIFVVSIFMFGDR